MTDTTTALEGWVDKKGLARHFSCSVRSIELAMVDGLPYTVIFGRAKFRASICEAWLEANGRLVDIVALPTPKPIPLNTQQPWWRPMLIQTRTTDHPYKRFSPHERQTLTELAERCGATAWLAHWPANARHPAWIPSEHFPPARAAA